MLCYHGAVLKSLTEVFGHKSTSTHEELVQIQHELAQFVNDCMSDTTLRFNVQCTIVVLLYYYIKLFFLLKHSMFLLKPEFHKASIISYRGQPVKQMLHAAL